MKKKVILGSLSAAALSALLLINGNTKVQAASDNSQHNSGNTTHEQAVDPIQAAQANVHSAQEAVHTAQGEVTNKENALQQAKTDHEGAITAYDDQAKNVQDAQKVVNQKQAALDEAQRAAQEATPEKIAQVQRDLDEANRQKTTDEAAVTSKQTEHDQKQTDYNTAKSEAEAAAQEAANKKTALDSAKTALEAAQAALNNAGHENHSSITIDNDFVNAIHQAQEYLTRNPGANVVPENISSAIKAAGATLIKNNRYQSVAADKNEVIDMGHITNEQMNNIRVFYLNLLNGIRSQLGYEPLKYNESAMKLSDTVAQKYEADHWDPLSQGHDVPALEAGYNEVGMPGTYEEAMGFLQKGWVPNYERADQNSDSSMSLTQSSNPSVVTLDDVKNNLYGVVSNMLFNDETSNWGHTFTLTHPDSTYMGFSISKHHDEGRGDYLAFHMNPVNPTYISELAKFGQHANLPLTNSSSSSSELQAAAQRALDNATGALTAAQTAYDNANTTKAAKEQADNDAKRALENATSALAAAQATVTADQTNSDHLTTQLNELQHQAQAVNEAQRALTTAQTALTTAQNTLSSLKPARDAAQAQIAAAQTALDTARTNLQTAQNRLTQAQAHLNDLQHPSISFDDNDDSVVVTPQTPVVSPVTPVDLSATLNEGSIPVYDQSGQVIAHLNGGQKLKLTNQMTINGQVFYQITNTNHWVSANDLSIKAKTSKKSKKAKKTSVSHKYRRVARTVKKVRLVDAKGRKTKRTLKAGTSWKTFARKKINGKWYYRLGTQKQWARASAMKVLKHSKF